LCVLAYYVEWHMRRALAPILFDDEDKEFAESLRASIVAAALRSPKARSKARTKRTADDEPVHSFQTLLKDLATLAKNRVRPSRVKTGSPTSVEFEMLTTPTPHQHRAFELLEIRLSP